MYDRALKLIRQYHRLSQAELADKLGLSRSFVSELEKPGGKKPSIDVLNAMRASSRSRCRHCFFSPKDRARPVCAKGPEHLRLTRF